MYRLYLTEMAKVTKNDGNDKPRAVKTRFTWGVRMAKVTFLARKFSTNLAKLAKKVTLAIRTPQVNRVLTARGLLGGSEWPK